MGHVELSSDRLELVADIEDDTGYDIVEATRSADGDGFSLEVETEDLSFSREIGTEAARAVFDSLTSVEDQSENRMDAFVADLTQIQYAFFGVLAREENPVPSTPLRKKMRVQFGVDVDPRALGGSLKGSHAKAKSRFGERIQSANWLENDQEYEYYVKEAYSDQLREAFAERE